MQKLISIFMVLLIFGCTEECDLATITLQNRTGEVIKVLRNSEGKRLDPDDVETFLVGGFGDCITFRIVFPSGEEGEKRICGKLKDCEYLGTIEKK